MTDNPNARIDVSDPAELVALDSELAALERQLDPAPAGAEADAAARDAQHYRFALVHVLEQALSIEELESLAFSVQWALDRRAVDQETAAKAVVAYADRHAPRLRRRASDALTHAERMEADRLAHLAEQIAARWRARVPAAFINRSNG